MEFVFFISGFLFGIFIVLIIFKFVKRDENNIENVFNKVLDNYNKHFLFLNNQSAGIFGEYILENILISSGLKKDREYFLQKQFDDKRPDVIVKLCDGRLVFIDSKANLKDYYEYLNAVNEKDKNKKLKQLKQAIKSQIKNLSEKNYHNIQHSDSSIDFTLMFIPIESAYKFLFDDDNDLFNYAIKKDIMIVSPSSLICILRIINSFNLKFKQENNIKEIIETASCISNNFLNIIKDVKQIENTLFKINRDVNSNNGMLKQIEKLEEFGVNIKTDDNILL